MYQHQRTILILNTRFLSESIPEAVLLRLWKTKSMTSESAKKMQQLLEVIKNYAHLAKESGYSSHFECSDTTNLIEQKLTDSIVRNFKRWLYREHKTKCPNVDLLITFLTNETELEECLNQSHSSKSKFVNVSKIHSMHFQNSCTLCGENCHKFVKCKTLSTTH